MKTRKIFLLIFLLSLTCVSGRAELINTKNFKKEYGVKYTNQSPKQTPSKTPLKTAPQLNVFIISNANLFVPTGKSPETLMPADTSVDNNPYPKLDHNLSFTEFTQKLLEKTNIPAPNKISSSMYHDSETLLNKALQEIIFSLRSRPVDMVVFGGNQVYSNDYTRYFKEMSYALDTYRIPNYQTLGPNDLRGPESTEKLIKDRYFMLKSRGVNFLILDNSSYDLVPERIPEEATDQLIWLTGMLNKLNQNQEELVIIAHKALKINEINFLNQFTKLNLRLIINSDSLEFKKSYETRLISEPLLINTPSLITYPCSYLNISKNVNNEFEVRPINIDLPQIQDLAKSRLGIKN
jgi:hypothetical protein